MRIARITTAVIEANYDWTIVRVESESGLGILRDHAESTWSEGIALEELSEPLRKRVMGIVTDSTPLEAPKDPDYRIDSFPEYTRNLFEALLNVQVNAFNNSPDDKRRTIVIDNLGVRTTDFSLSNEMKCKLIQQGVIAACKYLDGQPQP